MLLYSTPQENAMNFWFCICEVLFLQCNVPTIVAIATYTKGDMSLIQYSHELQAALVSLINLALSIGYYQPVETLTKHMDFVPLICVLLCLECSQAAD